jgi:hypothetical protein
MKTYIFYTNLLPKNIIGITLYPFIFLKKNYFLKNKNKLDVTLNHEKIHIQQQKELFVLFFYLLYITEYLIKTFKYGTKKAYFNLSFEREAYTNEKDFNYLESRKFLSFLKYF